MKSIFIVWVAILAAPVAQAAVKISCFSTNSSATLKGTVNSKTVTLLVVDARNSLGIRDFNGKERISFSVLTRKKEPQYQFARYYNDYNAWDGLDFSLPKSVISGAYQGRFAAYFTIYTDNGDMMVPGEPKHFICQTGDMI